MDDWLQLHDLVYDKTRDIFSSLLDGTFLESSSNDIAFFVFTLGDLFGDFWWNYALYVHDFVD
ncbi:MAG: hypothetical protein CM15mP71_3790 [Candidatus Poseidoniales archaeon]|nr:MAG: hypothetical protein CM15mP71_3790 [Candidatus Poseidoniales archaeon]